MSTGKFYSSSNAEQQEEELSSSQPEKKSVENHVDTAVQYKPSHAVNTASEDRQCVPSHQAAPLEDSGNSNIVTAVDAAGSISNNTGNAINFRYHLQADNVSRNMTSNYYRVEHLLAPETFHSRVELIRTGQYAELADVATSGSQVRVMADNLVEAGRWANRAGNVLSGITVGADTISEYMTTNGDISRTASAFTASAGWNIGGGIAAASLGCIAGNFVVPALGCVGGALATVGAYVLTDFFSGEDIVDWGTDLIDANIYQPISNQLTGDYLADSGRNEQAPTLLTEGNEQASPPLVESDEYDVLYNADGGIVYLGDSNDQWYLSSNGDGSGIIQLADQVPVAYSADDRVAIDLIDRCDPSPGEEADCERGVRFEVTSTSSDYEGKPVEESELPAERDNTITDGYTGVSSEQDLVDLVSPTNVDQVKPTCEDNATDIPYIPAPPADVGGQPEDEGRLTVADVDTESPGEQDLSEQNTSTPVSQCETLGQGYEDNSPLQNLEPEQQPADVPVATTLDDAMGPDTDNDLSPEIEIAAEEAGQAEADDPVTTDLEGEHPPETSSVPPLSSQEDHSPDNQDDEAPQVDNPVQATRFEEVPFSLDHDILEATTGLGTAMESGDGLTMLEGGLDYYQEVEQRMESSGRGGMSSRTTDRVIEVTESGLGLADAIDEGDSFQIAVQGVDFITDLDHLYESTLQNGSEDGDGVLSASTEGYLSLATSGLGLAQALDSGDGLQIVQSSLNTISTADHALSLSDSGLGAGASNALSGAGSAVGLVANVSQLSDAFESGDYGQMAYSVSSTINNAIGTWNAISNALELGATANIGSNYLPGVGYAAAALQLANGDVEGAAVSATSTYLMTCGPYGWAAAAVLQLGNALCDGPALSAEATFTLDGQGRVVMDVSGDEAMTGMAASYGGVMAGYMQDYGDRGGNLQVDDSLPWLEVEEDNPLLIGYESDGGGKVNVEVENPGDLLGVLDSCLSARERIDTVSDAYTEATDANGVADQALVDSILEAQGYERNGFNYSRDGGSDQPRVCGTRGNGVIRGGEQEGGTGRTILARNEDITYAPLRPEQRPSQTQGQLLRGIPGSDAPIAADLLALGLGVGTTTLTAAEAEAAGQEEDHNPYEGYFRPLDGWQSLAYQTGQLEFNRQADQTSPSAEAQVALPEDAEDLADYLHANWPTSELPLRTDPSVNQTGNPTDRGEMPETWGTVEDRETEPIAARQQPAPGQETEPSVGSAEAVDEQVDRPASSAHHTPGTGYDGAIPETVGSVDLAVNDTQALPVPASPETTAPPTGTNEPPGPVEVIVPDAPAPPVTGEPATEGTPEPVEETAPLAGARLEMNGDTVLRYNSTALALAPDDSERYTSSGSNTFVDLGEAENGRVWLDEAGDIRFEPDVGFSGTGTFDYTVRSAEDELLTYQAQVEVNPVNSRPLLVDDTFTLDEGTPLFLDQVLENDTDTDGDTLQIDHFSGLENGRLAVVDERQAFIPEAGFTGTLTFSYWAGDGEYPDLASVNLTYQDLDTAPLAGDDAFLILENEPLAIRDDELLANDREADNEAMTLVDVDEADHGRVVLENDGTIRFTPDQDYFGTDAGFTYTVEDEGGLQSTAWVAIEVINTPGEDDAATELGGTTGEIPVSGITAVESETAPSNGDTPASSDIWTEEQTGGPLRPDELSVEAETTGREDQGKDSGQSSIDSPPATTLLTLEGEEEEDISTTESELLASLDVDPASSLEVTLGAAAHGLVGRDESGKFVFTPNLDYFGDEAGFTVNLDDGDASRDYWVAVNLTNLNDAPEVVHDHLFLQEDEATVFDSNELDGFTVDADGDRLHLDEVSNVSGGSVVYEDGQYTFTPTENYSGEAGFDYVLSDDTGAATPGHMDITILPVNDLPENIATSAEMTEDGELTFSVDELMTGVEDVEDGSEVRFNGIDSSVHGHAYVDDNRLVHFQAEENYNGQAFFRYQLTDSEGGTGYGYVAVDVQADNDAPEAVDDQHILAWGTNGYTNIYSQDILLANDRDIDSDTLSVTGLGEATHGTASMDENNNIVYQAPEEDWVGLDRFTYTITDGNGESSEAVAELEVRPNAEPQLTETTLMINEDTIVTFAEDELLANATDPDGDSLHVIGLGTSHHCTVELLTGGQLRVTPEQDYNNLYPEPVSFEYFVTDGINNPVSNTATVNVLPVNDGPVAIREVVLPGVLEDNSLIFSEAQLLGGNGGDVEERSEHELDDLSYSFSSEQGICTHDEENGLISFTPEEHFNGNATITYTITDMAGESDSGEATIEVESDNDSPIVEHDVPDTAVTATRWSSFNINNLLANDSDVDGPHEALHLHGAHVVEGNADLRIQNGNLEVRPAEGENQVIIGYTVSDAVGGSTPSYLTINEILSPNHNPEFTGSFWMERDDRITGSSDEGSINIYRQSIDFSFQVRDQDGGDSWTSDWGEIRSVRASEASSNFIHNLNMVDHNDGSFSFDFNNRDGELASVTEYIRFHLSADDYHGGHSVTPEIQFTSEELMDVDEDRRLEATYLYSPVVLDLDGDGVELLSVDQGTTFDWYGDEEGEVTGWVGGDDGILVYDYDGDRQVTHADEMSLRDYDPEAQTDLEGLRAFDSNSDTVFDSNDDNWGRFGIWQDANSNAVTDDGEFATLDESGITGMELYGQEKQPWENEGNTIYTTVDYHLADGSTGEAADVGLTGETIIFTEVQRPESDPEDSDTPDSDGNGASDGGEAGWSTTGDRTTPDQQTEGTDVAVERYRVPIREEVDSLKGSGEIIGVTKPRVRITNEEEPPDDPSLAEVDAVEIHRLTKQLQSDMAAYHAAYSSEETSLNSCHLQSGDWEADPLDQSDDLLLVA